MTTLNDTTIFAAVIQHGGFGRAARHLGLSAGLISRRISQLETKLGVTLIKRTTRQLELTAEGELFFNSAERIQQELSTAISLIQASAKKPKGHIKISAPLYFGRHYLTPIIVDFLSTFTDIKIDLILGNHKVDLIKEQLDLVIRGSGYIDESKLKDSSMKMKRLHKEEIALYASPQYLLKQGEPKDPAALANYNIINFTDASQGKNAAVWSYHYNNKKGEIIINDKLNTNDIESALTACASGYGIGKFTDLNARKLLAEGKLQRILTEYSWGEYYLYVLYPQQKTLPKRTRLLIEFIETRLNPGNKGTSY